MKRESYGRLVLFCMIFCISGISAAGAITVDYVGIDKVDLQWGTAGEDFQRYDVYRDNVVITTIYTASRSHYRDEGVPAGTHTYKVLTVISDDSWFSPSVSADVGEPRGTLKLGDDTWSDQAVTLGGDVNLGGHTLTITGSQVSAGSEYDICGSGNLSVQNSEFSGVTIDATAPAATIEKVTSDRPIKVRGGGIGAQDVTIPWGTTWGPGDHLLYLYGDNNTITACNAEVHIQGDFGIIKDCSGENVKIAATGDNITITNNILRNVPGQAIYASGNDLSIRSNEITNASTEGYGYGIGIYLDGSNRGIDVFDNTISEAQDEAIYATGEYDTAMANYTFSFNTIRDCGYGLHSRGKVTCWSITDNTFDACSDRMIYISQANLTTIRDNTLENITDYGITFSGDRSQITKNTLKVIDSAGMDIGTGIDGGNLTVSQNTVTGIPTDDGSPDGIYFSAEDSVLEDNIVEYCRNGIDTSYKLNMTIRDNQIYDCWGEWGLYFYDSYLGLVENNTFFNVSTDVDAEGVIYVHHTGNATVRNNVIDGGRNGVYIEFADDGLVIERNTIKNVTSCAVRVNMAKHGDGYRNYRGPANVTTRDNTIVSSGYTGYNCRYVYGTSFVNNTVTNVSQGIDLSIANDTVIQANCFEEIRTGFYTYAVPGLVVKGNTFNVTETGGKLSLYSPNCTLADNRISGYDLIGVEVKDPDGAVLRNNTLAGSGTAWDLYMGIPEGERQDTLLLEENTFGTAHPTTVTITALNGPVYIRGVEDPPEPPSPPDYQTTKSSIGKWIEIYGEMGQKEVEMNLTFAYTKDDLNGVEEETLSIWKYNGTGWEAGNDLPDSWNGTRWQDFFNHEIGVEVKKLCIFAPLGGQTVHNTRIPRDYSTITEALDDLEFKSGDTITVDEGYSGTQENVRIYTEVKLKSSSGTPASVTLTALDAYEPTVKVCAADDVEIDGFVITGSTGSQGVRMEGCDNTKVMNCRLEGNFFGVSIGLDSYDKSPSTYCKVIDCTVTGNEHGAVLINLSNNCNVLGSTLSGDVGIGIVDAENTYVSGNTIANCDDYGIAVDGGKNNEVTDCTITGGELGIYLYGGEAQTVTDCTVTDTNAPGILLEETEGNTVSGITVTGAPLGLACDGADDNTFTGIQVNGGNAGGSSLVGIALDDSDGNVLSGCAVENLRVVGYSATGIEMTGTSRANTVETCRFTGFESSRVDGAVFASSGNLIRNSTFTGFRGAAAGAAGISARENTTGNAVRRCTFDGLYAPENATAFLIAGAKNVTIADCTVGTVAPANTSAFAVFEDSAYSNVIEGTVLGNLAEVYELRAAGNLTVSNTNAIPPDEDDVRNIGHYLNLTSDGSGEAWISFAYADEDLNGKNPALLSVWRHDDVGWQKAPAPNGVNTAEHYVYAYNVTEFSVFAPMWSGSGLPKANFTADQTDGNAPLAVAFTDLSKNADAWLWTFGDGETATEQNPQHTYTTVGRFNVTLEVSNAAGTDTMTRYRYIAVRDLPVEPAESTENFTLGNDGATVTDVGGRQQVSFNATAGNGTVSGNDILLHNGNMNVTVQTDGLSTVGNVSTGNVTGVLLEGGPVGASLDGDVGNVSVGFNASMNGYNPDLGITTSIYDRPSDEATNAFTLAAAGDGLSITSTAYAVYFTKSNLTADDAISDAYLRMTVSPDWVEANGGTDVIRVFRQGDDGDTEVLATTYLGLDADGMMVFEAYSPDGFSSFAVAAIASSPTPAPSSGGGGGSTDTSSAASAGSLQAGETATLQVRNSPVTGIVVEAAGEIDSLMITVNEQNALPADVPAPDADVWRYLSITLYRADPSTIGKATITFGVPADLLGDGTAVLMRLNGSIWETLPTEPAGTADGTSLFTAETPGFSWFAIAIADEAAASGESGAAVSTTAPASQQTAGETAATTGVPATATPLSATAALLATAGACLLFGKKRP